ncbi:DoxX family protein [Agarivorans gilvus]|uniref:Membrane protein n=1 Tax=Agarivorans gilvus TaxID=680279 RepID=A0ABQ1I6J2_9ALTE|nr:DoxX family protein [Agarivorans gilvus]GGB21634.1 membrane protein [Agarivorans gilvus]
MIEQKTAAYAALLLRLISGGLFVAHGLTKVFVFTIPGTVGYFESLGLPGFVAYFTIVAELFGGLALLLGVATRWVSVPLVALLLGVVWAHSGNGWGFTNAGGGWEFPLFWAAAQAAIGLLGNGALALKIPVANKLFGQYA